MPSFFNQIQKVLRGKSDKIRGLEISVNVPVFRYDIIDFHEFGKGCNQRICLFQAFQPPIFIKGRLGHFKQIVILNLQGGLNQSEKILFKIRGKIPLNLPDNSAEPP